MDPSEPLDPPGDGADEPARRQPTEELLPEVYAELCDLARSAMARLRAGQTLQPTALVHEAVVRLRQRGESDWESRGHLVFAAARAMRQILVEDARRKLSRKRGDGSAREDVELVPLPVEESAADTLAIEEALERLKRHDAGWHRLVVLRFYGGLSTPEVADALGIPLRTAEREWQRARDFLRRALRPGTIVPLLEDGGLETELP